MKIHHYCLIFWYVTPLFLAQETLMDGGAESSFDNVSVSEASPITEKLSQEAYPLVEAAYKKQREGDHKAAAVLTQAALKIDPSNYQLAMLMMQISEQMQNWENVEKYASLALSKRPKDDFAYATRGFARKHLNNGSG